MNEPERIEQGSEADATPLPQEQTLYDVLMRGANVGDDADFEWPLDDGRPVPELD